MRTNHDLFGLTRKNAQYLRINIDILLGYDSEKDHMATDELFLIHAKIAGIISDIDFYNESLKRLNDYVMKIEYFDEEISQLAKSLENYYQKDFLSELVKIQPLKLNVS